MISNLLPNDYFQQNIIQDLCSNYQVLTINNKQLCMNVKQ